MRGLVAAVSLLTVVPVGRRVTEPDLARAVPWFPVVGAGVGLALGLVYAAVYRLLSPLPAAVVTVAVGVFLTGGFHEDGLADAADGLGSRRGREEAIRIMRQPTLGSYGVLAVVLSVALRLGAVSVLQPDHAPLILSLVHLSARAGMVGVLAVLPAASDRGLAAAHGGDVGAWPVVLSLGFALGGGGLALRWAGAGVALASLAGATVVGALAWRRLRGATGDVLGAAEQVAEVFGLLSAAALVVGGIL